MEWEGCLFLLMPYASIALVAAGEPWSWIGLILMLGYVVVLLLGSFTSGASGDDRGRPDPF